MLRLIYVEEEDYSVYFVILYYLCMLIYNEK